MKIAFFVTDFPTLSETFIAQQVLLLSRSGHTIDIYARSPGENGQSHHEEIAADKHIRVFYILPGGTGSFAKRLLTFLRSLTVIAEKRPHVLCRLLCNFSSFRHSPVARFQSIGLAALLLTHAPHDVIHCHFGPNGLAALFLKELGIVKQPFITTFHGSDFNVISHKHGPEVYKKLFQEGALFTVNSSFMFDQLVAADCPPEAIIKLPVGIDLEKFQYTEKRLPLSATVHILSVGSLLAVKGFAYSIRALAIVARTCPEVILSIIGVGPLRSELVQLAKDLQISQHIRFLGGIPHEEIGHYYEQAHLFLYSGITAENGAREAQGLVLAEAQAAGLPVIATRVGGVPESIVDGSSGLLVPEKNPPALAEAIIQLITDSARWPAMGRAGRAHVERNFNDTTRHPAILEAYQRVARPTSARGVQ